MPRVRPARAKEQGSVIGIPHLSSVLEGNPWDDPVARTLHVYLPPGYDESASPYVTLWDLAAFTNAGPGHLNWRHHGENLPQRLDRLISEGLMPPVVVALPDCFTSLGGNQYLNSASVGAYADYVHEELLPLLSGHVNVLETPQGRGAFGKSSGGYGALRFAVDFPEAWGAVASHAADMGFEWVYLPEFPSAVAALRACDGDVHRFLEQFWRNRKRGKLDYSALLIVAMAATYDPDPSKPEQIHLPFDLETCEIDHERWQRWLNHDLLRMDSRRLEALASLEALYIDAGNRDEYNIQYGTRLFARKLEKLGIRHHYVEFEGTHSGMDWRLDHSLPIIAKALHVASYGEDQ